MASRLSFLAAALLLAACGSQGGPEPADDAETGADEAQAETAAAEPSPFDTLLPWNAEADAVETTESGLQYIVLREGPEDGLSPGDPRDRVTVMYEGRLTTGEKFDSSYDRGAPATFQLNQVISGWTEGLQLMSTGDEYMFYIPAELGYGDSPRPGGLIKPGDDLVFRVELQDVDPAPEPVYADEEAFETYLPWDSSRDAVKKTGSGLEFIVLDKAEDDGPSPTGGEMVVVHYEGRIAETGEIFDSSFKRQERAMFPADKLIPGWVEALKLMKPGDRWLLYIPSDLAYGPAGKGPIGPNSDLVFEVQMFDVLPVQ